MFCQDFSHSKMVYFASSIIRKLVIELIIFANFTKDVSLYPEVHFAESSGLKSYEKPLTAPFTGTLPAMNISYFETNKPVIYIPNNNA